MEKMYIHTAKTGTTVENTCDKDHIARKSKTKKINNLFLAQKKSISWKGSKCHEILDQFKSEQINSNSTLKEVAQGLE